MSESQRERLRRQEQDYLKGSETESARYRHAFLTNIREIRRSVEIFGASLLLVALAASERRADYVAAAGALMAVMGILRFRTGYVVRVRRINLAFTATLPDGQDDATRSEASMASALTEAERNGLALAVVGTLVNGFSGLVGHLLGWVN